MIKKDGVFYLIDSKGNDLFMFKILDTFRMYSCTRICFYTITSLSFPSIINWVIIIS